MLISIFALPMSQMADLYKYCDLDTLMNFFGKMAMFKFLETSAKQVTWFCAKMTMQGFQ